MSAQLADWLPSLPSGWSMKPFYCVFTERKQPNVGLAVDNVLSLSYGRIVERDVESNHGLLPASFEGYNIVEPRDIVMRLTDLQNDQRSLRTGQVEERGVITSAYVTVTPAAEIHPRFAHYLLHGYDLAKLFYRMGGGLRQSMKFDDLKRMPVVLPPPGDQERIANFLDEQTARIDALIAEKERLMVLLSEQRLSIAERVMADSASGTKAKLGFHADFLAGYAFPSDEFSRDESDIPLLRGVNVAPASIRWDDVVYWRRDYDTSLERFRLQAGDVVFGMDRPWISSGARVAMIDADSAGAFLLQRVCRLRGGSKMRQRFLFYALSSDAFRQSIEVDLTGVSVPHISPEQVLGFKVPVLTPEEQDVRCAEADRQTEALQGLATHTDGLLNRLREYRSSLISAAVTGQLDLSTFKAAE